MRAPHSATLPSLSPSGALATTPAQAGAALILSLLAGLALVASPAWWVAFGLVGVAALTALGLIRPALFLSLFLFVRPVLDEFSQVTAGVPSANVAGALGALLVAIAIVVLVARRQTFTPPTTLPLMAIGLMSVVAAAQASLEIGSSLGLRPASELVRLAALLAVFLLAANLTAAPHRARALFAIVALSAIVPAGYGIWELVAGAPVKEGSDTARISGTFTGPVPFGAFLAFTSLIMIFGPMEKVRGWIRWPTLALMLVALTASYSRVGWVLFVVGLAILAWPRQKRLVVALVAVLIGVAAAFPTVRERALPLGDEAPSAESSAAGYESYGWRIENWSGLLDRWAERPVLGYGLDSVTFVNPRAPVGGEGRAGGGYEAHNMLVRILVEGGVVLLAVYLIYFGAIISRLFRLSRERWEMRDESRLLFVIWALTLFTGATTDDPITLTALMVGLLALTGAVEGAWRGRERTAEQPEANRAATGMPWQPATPGAGVG